MDFSKSVVVLGQNYSTSLGIIKAVGLGGYRCELGKRCAVSPGGRPFEASSRYVSKCAYWEQGNNEEMVKYLIDTFSATEYKRVLFPADDTSASFVDRNYNRLSAHFELPNRRGRQCGLEDLMNKNLQKELASSCQLNVAGHWCISFDREGHFELPEGITYPCFIKPMESVGNSKAIMKKCDSEAHLISHLDSIDRIFKNDILVEEFIAVEEEFTIPVMAIGDEVMIPSVLKKDATGKGDHRGVTLSGLVESSDSGKYTGIVDKLKYFVHSLQINGLFDIEVMKSGDRFYFNELNLRNGAAAYALTSAGINLPQMYVDSFYKHSNCSSTMAKAPLTKSFVNDKAALDYYYSGYCSFPEYLKIIRNKDIHLVYDGDSLYLKLSFYAMVFRMVVKRLLKKIIRH